MIGGATTTDPDEIKCCVGMNLFRTNAKNFPVAPNQFAITSLTTATVSTSGGSYTWALTAAVSKKEKISPGIYILVPTTFEPGVLATFEASLYTVGNVMQVAHYKHTS